MLLVISGITFKSSLVKHKTLDLKGNEMYFLLINKKEKIPSSPNFHL